MALISAVAIHAEGALSMSDKPVTPPSEDVRRLRRYARHVARKWQKWVSRRDRKSVVRREQKGKDNWDKVQILSGLVSSVVIAIVGLLINSSIQQAQIAASKANSDSQISVSKQNNDALVSMNERVATLTRQLQEGTLTTQLLETLTSGTTSKKQLAIVVLRRSLPPEMYQDLITIIMKSDTDPEVRKTALEQARMLRDVAPSIAQAIAQIALDTSRPNDERQLANTAVGQLGLKSTASNNTYLLSASGSDQIAYTSPNSGGGIFTEYLIRGLSGEAISVNRETEPSVSGSNTLILKANPNVRFSDLSKYLSDSVTRFTQGKQTVVSLRPAASDDPIIVGSEAKYSNVVVLAIGNDIYRDTSFVKTQYSGRGAQLFSQFWRDKNASSISLNINATRAQMLNALSDIGSKTSLNSLEIVYYSGRAFSNKNGVGYLEPVDANPNVTETDLEESSISTLEVRDRLAKNTSSLQLLIIDAAFPGTISSR